MPFNQNENWQLEGPFMKDTSSLIIKRGDKIKKETLKLKIKMKRGE